MLRDVPRNPLLVQVLSLYLLLLAFFVVLNTISKVEDARSKAVTGSLNETFSADGHPNKKTVHLVSSQGNILANAEFLSRVGNLIKTELAFAEVSDVEPGRLMAVTMSAISMTASVSTPFITLVCCLAGVAMLMINFLSLVVC